MSRELTNKVVIVTGGANGIGRLIVTYALEEGAKHIAVLDVSENGFEFEAELNNKHGSKAKFYKCDVTNESLLKNIFDTVKRENGTIDVVINNAGIMNDSIHLYKKEIEINFTAAVTSTLKSLEIMRKDEGGNGGTVINISSTVALFQEPILPIYFATKSALLQFSNCIGMDAYYSRTQVRILTVCFGATDTALLTKEKCGNFDKVINDNLIATLQKFPIQSAETAARGVIECFKKGKTGSQKTMSDFQCYPINLSASRERELIQEINIIILQY